jgi:hypothetical protein
MFALKVRDSGVQTWGQEDSMIWCCLILGIWFLVVGDMTKPWYGDFGESDYS